MLLLCCRQTQIAAYQRSPLAEVIPLLGTNAGQESCRWMTTVRPADTLLPTGKDLGAVPRNKVLERRAGKVGMVSIAAPLGMAG